MEQIGKTRHPVHAHPLFLTGFAIVLTGVAMLMARVESWLPLFVMAALCFAVLILMKPDIGVGLYLMTIPLQGIGLFDLQLGGISGLKLSNIIPLFVILAILLENAQESLRARDFILPILLFSLFTIAIFRSLIVFRLDPSPLILDGEYNTIRFLLSLWIRPLLFFLAMWIVAVRRHTLEQVGRLLLYMQVSLMGMSLYILYMYVFVIADRSNFETVRDIIGLSMKQHGNGLADFYIIGFPLLLVYALLKKNLFSYLNIGLAFAAVAVIYSRTAYFTILIEIVLFLILTRKANILPFVVGVMVVVVNFLPRSILDRALTGTDSGSADALSAGRTDHIWAPLVAELFRKPLFLLFGNGRYAILHTDAMIHGEILKVIHAHNFYLDAILDMGLVGMSVFLTFYLLMLVQAFKIRKEARNPFTLYMSAGLAVSILGFMIRGLSDSTMLPAANNAFIWIVFGLCQLLSMVLEKDRERIAGQSL